MSKALGAVLVAFGAGLAALSGVAACSSSSNNHGKICSAGETQSCEGPGACKGTQSCVKEIGWGPCNCVSGTGGAAGGGGTGGTITGGSGGTGGSGAVPACNPTGTDADGDCFGDGDGDCDDTNPLINPGAYDYPGDGVDDDCSGTPDDAVSCDSAITDIADADPLNGAKAIGLCQTATLQDKKWGVISAKYVMADGKTGMNDKSHGLLAAFGANVPPREGARMLVLSSATARQPSDPDYQPPGSADMGTKGTAPSGFPIDSPSCKGVLTKQDKVTNDPAALEISLRVPSNAKSFRVESNYYTYEFPTYVCTQYNDFYVALQFPAPKNAQFGNIAFDGEGNPVSVNNAYLRVCTPQTAGGKTFDCPLGTDQLVDTGFEDHASTGWLRTRSPVTPRAVITLRFAIWDMGDHILGSTILIDNFLFTPDELTDAQTEPIVPGLN